MTVGDGILWSTVLILLAATIYQFSVRKLARRVFGGLFLVVVVGGSGMWAWNAYQNRPYIVQELEGVRIGMTPVEVKLLKGEPSQEGSGGDGQLTWVFVPPTLDVIFSNETETVYRICHRGFFRGPMGLRFGSSEGDVVNKLGQPTTESISADALSKLISFDRWKVAYGIERGRAEMICVFTGRGLHYEEEFGEESQPEAEPTTNGGTWRDRLVPAGTPSTPSLVEEQDQRAPK